MKYLILFIILSISLKTFADKRHDHIFRDYTSKNINFNILINTNNISQLNIKSNIQNNLNNFFKTTFPNQKSTFVSNNNSLKRDGDNINIIITINKVNISVQDGNYVGDVCLVVNVYDVSKTPIQLRKKTLTTKINDRFSNKQNFINLLIDQANSSLTEYLKETISTPTLKHSNYIINNL